MLQRLGWCVRSDCRSTWQRDDLPSAGQARTWGNSSSEVRVTSHGAAAFHAYARETGIISELLIEERAVNHEEIRDI